MTIGTKRWIAGSIGALISGGAAAVTASATVIISDPKDWENFHQIAKLILLTFFVPGIVSLAKYLQQHPVPDEFIDQPDKRAQ